MADKRKLELKDVLYALDRGDKDYYDLLSDEQKKEFSPLVIMRFMSSSKTFVDHHLLMANELVNAEFIWSKEHHKLQWLLLCICGTGKRQFHEWIPGPKRMKKNKIQEFLSKLYPLCSIEELEIMEEINDQKELKNLAKEHGYTDEELNEIFK